MGLDTTHNAWHGPYPSFNRFRESLMLLYNETNLRDYDGFGGSNLMYKSVKDKGLLIFFGHSDCDGEINYEDCKLVSDGLLSLIPKITDDYLLDRVKQFSDGCLLAYAKKETLEFH